VKVNVGLLASCLALFSASCAKPPPPADTLRLVVQSPPEAIDPRFATSAIAVRLSHLVFAPLFEIGDDLNVRPLLAEKLERTDDTTYLVTLPENARFHDGTPLTAADVVYTYGELGSEDVKSPHAPKFKRVKSVVADDPRTVRFTLNEPFAAFPIELCALGIVSRAQCEGKTAACRESPTGSGPFRVTAFDAAAEVLELAAYPDFVRGAPSVPKVTVRAVRDSTTRLLELIDEKADLVIGDISPVQLDAVKRHAHLKWQSARGLGFTYLAMNLRPPRADQDAEETRTRRALSSPMVRRAIAHAIDLERLIDKKLRGAAVRATGMLPPGHWAKAAGTKAIAYNPERARAMLDEAGFHDRDGGRFSVVLNTTSNRLRRSIAVLIAEQLRAVGIDVTLRVGEWSTLYADIKRGNFEMFSAKWTPVVEPDLMHWVFHSSNIPGEGAAGGNRGAYNDAEVDAWLEEGRKLLDPETRAPVYQRVEERLARDLPYVPMWFEDDIAVHNTRLRDLALRRTGSLYAIVSARLEPAK
jgi:peptide/nickel transport system substrate-binding protein